MVLYLSFLSSHHPFSENFMLRHQISVLQTTEEIYWSWLLHQCYWKNYRLIPITKILVIVHAKKPIAESDGCELCLPSIVIYLRPDRWWPRNDYIKDDSTLNIFSCLYWIVFISVSRLLIVLLQKRVIRHGKGAVLKRHLITIIIYRPFQYRNITKQNKRPGNDTLTWQIRQ